jgi:hypothetical protein
MRFNVRPRLATKRVGTTRSTGYRRRKSDFNWER